ncbi:uncharacterized protein LOC127835057 [Dreissena polymorpha]|uniref:uncharacterized protein LOC127835057 n=1 Tax=Dreissena polymorpha TaxID=45954 RepID=UPI002263CB5D|nr:uncharacterized protein LOC127835057 [Dreissena polymorpha]
MAQIEKMSLLEECEQLPDETRNKPKAAAVLSDEEIQKLYTDNILGATTPKSLLNTIWLNNSLHFGLRGTHEQYNLRWGDVKLKTDASGNEFLEFNERQTQTRTGANASDARKIHPKMFASPELGNRDPIYIYKQYSDKRPPGFSTDDSPFYLATRTVPLTDIFDQWFLRQKLGEKKLPRC